MSAKVPAIGSILVRRAMSNAVRERGLQAIVVGPNDVRVLVHYDARELLANSSPHDSRFAMMHGKAFFHHDRTHVQVKTPDDALKVAFARKSQVVRIARVDRASRICQAR